METIKNTLAQNFGGNLSKLGTNQFSLDDCPHLTGKVGVVTGGTRGIGYGVAYTFLKHNISKLYLISVNEEVAERAKKSIASELGEEVASRIRWIKCDLSDWNHIKSVAESIANDTDRLDILVNNSGRGVMTPERTSYGVDRHMAVNHIGHVVLTSQLLPLLKKTAEKGNVVRISNQASTSHNSAPEDTKFDSLDDINRDVGANAQYGRSKLANILYARYFDRNVTQKGHPNLLMNATHPGVVSTKQSKTDIHEPFPIAGYAVSTLLEPFKKSNFEGAIPTVFAATTTTAGGQYICPPATPEKGSELAQSDKLADNLMELTRKVVSEKTPGIEVAI
ncbi:retinol dehydrogenase 12 [Apodospora peruviana]|uniref:Retinol dehydrogenase 12 n=1 Tax=Apodospora peruviana TaxID=516989 RepID=A0AAE0M1E9_9PEZI|nr:retinol dehydrogenase 12 [Apodospora peruviana]